MEVTGYRSLCHVHACIPPIIYYNILYNITELKTTVDGPTFPICLHYFISILQFIYFSAPQDVYGYNFVIIILAQFTKLPVLGVCIISSTVVTAVL